MKKIVLIYISFIFCITSFSQNFCENFEGYSAGDPIAQTSSNWNSWGELMSGLTSLCSRCNCIGFS